MAVPLQLKTDVKRSVRPGADVDDTLLDINRQFAEKGIVKKAKELKMPYINIRTTPINPDLLRQIDLDACEKALALPFFMLGKKLRVAVADAESTDTRAYLGQWQDKNFQVFLSLASSSGIKDKIAEFRALQPKEYEEFENIEAEQNLRTYEEEVKKLKSLEEEVRQISAKAVLNQIFVGGLRTKASDIHFQPEEDKVIVRFRIDGILQKIIEFDHKDGKGITDHLKYESKLRLNVDDVPQDGRTSFLAGDRKINVRVSTLPTEFGESVVCRLLDSGKKILSLQELGFEGSNLYNINEALNRRSGMILVTGPTGSGKTTTLYTMIDMLNTPERKIATLENPVEYQVKNVIQSQINEDQDYTFASGLRALLRQDPDVLMVGEIRDTATAETAAQAAMTGHVVFSTLHTNSAIEAVPRLLNLQMKPYILVSSLSLVVAQRLVRKPCPKCAEKVSLSLKERSTINRYLAELKKNNPSIKTQAPEFLWEIKGCPTCSRTGYRGQLAIAETFRLTPELAELILANTSVARLEQHVRETQGMVSFAEDGLLKVCEGLTTLDEVARTTGVKFKL